MNKVPLVIVVAVFVLQAAQSMAQTLDSSLARIRTLQSGGNIFAASDHANDYVFREQLARLEKPESKEQVLWQLADVHLEAANRWPASAENAYAKRAIDAWIEYIEFSQAREYKYRIHQAVEYLQRSYFQARAFEDMFGAIAKISPTLVNDKVITRWEDRLRACPNYGETAGRAWQETLCSQSLCKPSVTDYYLFVGEWLKVFPLRAEWKNEYATRAARIPSSCR